MVSIEFIISVILVLKNHPKLKLTKKNINDFIISFFAAAGMIFFMAVILAAQWKIAIMLSWILYVFLVLQSLRILVYFIDRLRDHLNKGGCI